MEKMKDIDAQDFNEIFDDVITSYHRHNDIFFQLNNPYPKETLEYLLFEKCLIDTRQWHMEDEVRNPDILPEKGMEWKHMIDRSNQERTDIVEKIDDFFYQAFNYETNDAKASINTESPAWAVDRLSILALKIYHMREEISRKDADALHIEACKSKLNILLAQQKNLVNSINELFEDYKSGKKIMAVYRQLKMYNDPSLNPILYGKKK